MIKRILLSVLVLTSLTVAGLVPAGNVSATNVLGKVCSNVTAGASASVCQGYRAQSQNTTNPIISEIKIAINILSYIIGIVAVILIIVSGLRMVLGGSDPQTVNSSRDAIIYSLIGIVVVVVAQAIVVFVLNKIK